MTRSEHSSLQFSSSSLRALDVRLLIYIPLPGLFSDLSAESSFAVPTPESFAKKVKTKKRGGGDISGAGVLLVPGNKKSRPGGAGVVAGSQEMSMFPFFQSLV